ncbi:MAG: helix-turn-helix domain-containing protein [Chloroflexi bacterium]|nr:helix-turn-helix domain-containing protein [Chloroflexota bacterium]
MKPIGSIVRQRVERILIENEMLRAGFAALPYVVLRDTRLSIGARLTYAVLLSYAWQEASTFVGQRQMARDMGLSERQLQRYLYELRDRQYIEISRADRRFNNTYLIKDVKTKLKAKRRAGGDSGVVSETTAVSALIRRARPLLR